MNKKEELELLRIQLERKNQEIDILSKKRDNLIRELSLEEKDKLKVKYGNSLPISINLTFELSKYIDEQDLDPGEILESIKNIFIEELNEFLYTKNISVALPDE